MAQALASLHAACGEESFSLEYGRHAETAGLYCRIRGSLARTAEKQLAAAYPDLVIERLDETVIAPPKASRIHHAELWLAADVFATGTSQSFEDRLNQELTDPLAGLLGVIAAGPHTNAWSHVVVEVRAATSSRLKLARRILDRFYTTPLHRRRAAGSRYLRLATSPRWLARMAARVFSLRFSESRAEEQTTEGKAAYAKLAQPLFVGRIRLTAAAGTDAQAARQIQQLSAAFAPYTVNSKAAFHVVRDGLNKHGSLFSVDEIAMLCHPPTSAVRAERMEQVESRSFEPPAALPSPEESDAVVLGVTDFRRRKELVALKSDDRRRHMYVVGKTGTGKSTLLLNLLADDIGRGRGIGLIDPHGDLVDQVLVRVPRSRTNDLILFDPADHPIAYNPLACDRPEQRPLVAASVLSAMKKVFAIDETNAPRLLYILRNVLMALVEQPNATLLDVPRLLVDAAYRRHVVGRLSDPFVRSFWQDEFAGWNDRYRTEAIAPIQNKVGQFLTSPLIRRVFASAGNSLDLRQVMDTGKILLVNLSHGRLGEDSAALLGALLVTSIEQAAKSRADVAESRRRDFILYADEFQTYAGTESLSIILSQARKYRLSLCLANQLVDQMSPELAATVFGNVGSLCVMQVGHRDAEALAEELGGDVTPQDLTALPKYHAVLRMLIDGEPSRPFTIRTLPPPQVTNDHVRRETIRRVSQRRYTARSDRFRDRPTLPLGSSRGSHHRGRAVPSGASAAA